MADSTVSYIHVALGTAAFCFTWALVVTIIYATQYSNKSKRLREKALVPLENSVNLTNVLEQTNNALSQPPTMAGSFIHKVLKVSISVKREAACYILQNIKLKEIHDAITGCKSELLEFLHSNLKGRRIVTPSDDSVVVELDGLVETRGVRQFYDLVLAFHSNTDEFVEAVEFSIYIIHVRHRVDEQRRTQVLYSYCKTNWDRLIELRPMFAPGVDTVGGAAVTLNQLPDCAICLSERAANQMLLPCRHVAFCPGCLKAFVEKVQHSDRLLCPICRVEVRELRTL